MVKMVIVLIAIQYFISLFTIKNKSVRLFSKNKSMHSLVNNCCETHFHLLRMVLRSFVRHSTTELFLFFYCT